MDCATYYHPEKLIPINLLICSLQDELGPLLESKLKMNATSTSSDIFENFISFLEYCKDKLLKNKSPRYHSILWTFVLNTIASNFNFMISKRGVNLNKQGVARMDKIKRLSLHLFKYYLSNLNLGYVGSIHYNKEHGFESEEVSQESKSCGSNDLVLKRCFLLFRNVLLLANNMFNNMRLCNEYSQLLIDVVENFQFLDNDSYSFTPIISIIEKNIYILSTKGISISDQLQSYCISIEKRVDFNNLSFQFYEKFPCDNDNINTDADEYIENEKMRVQSFYDDLICFYYYRSLNTLYSSSSDSYSNFIKLIKILAIDKDLNIAQTKPRQHSETITQIIEDVGIYQGNFKVVNRQNGRIYLTTKRLFYVDNEDMINNSVFFKLCDINVKHERNMEVYSPSMVFVKSSPKVTIMFHQDPNFVDQRNKQDLNDNKKNESKTIIEVTWKCKICMHKNKISSNDYDFDLMINSNLNGIIEFPCCVNCGMKSNKNTVINAIKKYIRNNSEKVKQEQESVKTDKNFGDSQSGKQCQACTFVNHKLMQNCEVCGSGLETDRDNSSDDQKLKQNKGVGHNQNISRDFIILNTENDNESIQCDFIKLSFHNGNMSLIKKFLINLQQNLFELSLNKINKNVEQNKNVQQIIISQKSNRSGSLTKSGIAALESKQKNIISQNEFILESSLEDLNSLMDKAKQLQELVKSFDKILKKENQNANNNNNRKYLQTLSESKDALGINSNEAFKKIILSNNFNFLNKINDKEIFYRELARNISVFLSNYVFQSDNNKEKLITDAYPRGIISLIDLYALYNRSLGFNNNLISPNDLLESVKLFESLKLPLKFRKFEKNGLMVIQDAKSNDEEILNEVIDLLVAKRFKLQSFTDTEHFENLSKPSTDDVSTNDNDEIKGINIQMLVDHFNLNINILSEILYIGLENGMLLIDEDISGSNYYLNEMSDYVWNY